MSSRFGSTRRQFIQAAAATSAAGLVMGPTRTAFGVSNALANYALDLDGLTGGRVDSVELPAYEVRVHPKYGVTPFKACYTISEASDMLSWILSLGRRTIDLRSGRVLMADRQFAVKRRVDWTGGRIMSLKFPKLSTTSAARPLTVDFEWEVDTVQFREGMDLGVDKVPRPFPATTKAGPLLTANFRIVGLPGAESITDVELPTFTAIIRPEHYAEKLGFPDLHYVSFGDSELKLRFAAAGRAAAFKQVQKSIKDGTLTPDEFLDLELQILDAAKTTTRATFKLSRCGLCSYAEARYEANKDADSGCTLGFKVQSFELVFNKT